ncbi:MAG: glutathione S-transferase [Ancalomicrobiaceae bacterium]|nr:glutathione S-transferase [Ancalomicrobiaceae bacterium]
MAEFKLHCFGESGNSYRVALMLQLCGCDWEPVFVPFFKGGTRDPDWRVRFNEMGEAPVLEHGALKLTQSGVILDYLAERTGKFGPHNPEERREILRWILYDNHKFTSYYATLRFQVGLTHQGDPAVHEFLRGRVTAAWKIVDTHLAGADFLVGGRPTIADLSLAGYVYYTEETGLDTRALFPNIVAWSERIKALDGWQAPYNLMPRD